MVILPLSREFVAKIYTQKEGPSRFDIHFEGPSIPSFQAEKGPISLPFRHTHPGRLPNKSNPWENTTVKLRSSSVNSSLPSFPIITIKDIASRGEFGSLERMGPD